MRLTLDGEATELADLGFTIDGRGRFDAVAEPALETVLEALLDSRQPGDGSGPLIDRFGCPAYRALGEG